uniref:TSA: Wollemia nobilis Ref_Wollemi_Transcript_10409_2825 transcribed RNA sequence n=1 Tax=Wollemia nobilis TaxID=56998 RepID=A0A0C9QTK6_9CONI
MALVVAFFTCLCALWARSFAQQVGNGYRLVSMSQGSHGSLIGSLELIKKTNTYGPDIPHLQLYVKHETGDRVRVQITDAEKKRWEVPYNLLPRAQVPALGGIHSVKTTNPVFEFSEFSGGELVFSCTANPFGFAIKRKAGGDVLFNSSYGTLVFKDQYLEISTVLPTSASLYGLGENTQPDGHKIVPNQPYTLYTTDIAAYNLNVDLYGSHPFYMDLRKGGTAHGVLLLNSNGMDLFYTGSMLTYKIIGGLLDFYFFAGSSPLDVVQQYTAFIGRPAAMPYWAFGFHQCRWGYKNLSEIETVVENYNISKIPLDVIWNDDNHMDARKDFTLDPINYPGPKLRAFLDRIHANGQKYVVINDPGIAVNASYGTYQRGMAADIFIKLDGEPFLGQVWPGAVHFTDFLNPKAAAFWKDEIALFRELAPIDGLWIDMNEVSNFCSGKCTIPKDRQCPGPGVVWTCCLDCTNLTSTQWDVPPYEINATGDHMPLGFKTIATSAVHYNGVLEYDAHSLYGFSESIATHDAFQSLLNKRPFVLSRSSFVGSGAYAAHWTGDNNATWEDLRYSISTILNFGMFGMPMVGSDICGFYGYYEGTDKLAELEELCSRWIQLGAFYPFSRAHSNYATVRREMYRFPSVATSARKALGLRYRLLPYLYTLNYDAHTTGAPIARPVFFSFPEDEATYAVSTQYLLGPGVLISPVLSSGTTEVKAYLPRGSWYDLNDVSRVVKSNGEYVTLDAPVDTINVHLCEGMILPMQQGGMTTREAMMTPYTLVVAFPLGFESAGGKAQGHLFVDGGEDVEMKIAEGTSTYVEFFGESDGKTVRVRSEVQMGQYATKGGWVVQKLMVLGLSSPSSSPKSFVLDGKVYSPSTFSYTFSTSSVASEVKSSAMELSRLALPVGRNFDLSWTLAPTRS